MGLFLNILTILVTIIVLYYIFSWLFGSSAVTMTKMMSAKTTTTIPASYISSNNPSGNSGNFTYSMWFYVNDWNYRFGEEKVIFSRLNGDNKAGPVISFDTMENNILVTLSTYPTAVTAAALSNGGANAVGANAGGANAGGANVVNNANSTSQTNRYIVKNFQLQKWVNLIISVYGRTLDVYLDGKLVRTFVLPGIAKISPTSNANITPNGGFDGATSSFQYWANATNPQQAYNIYKNGFGGSILGNLFNKYRIKIAFLDDNIESGSIEI
jgi:hypothetical protein